MENLNDCLSVNCNWANASNLLWCGPRLVDDAAAAPGEVSTSHFLRRVAEGARRVHNKPARLAAAAAARARARGGREGDAAVALAAAADGARAALVDSDSDSGEDFLGRVGADLFEDDETPRRRPTRRGWTPGFHDVVDRGVTSFEADVGGRRVCCRLGYRESGTGSSVWDGAVVLARFLETHPSFRPRQAQLELGAHGLWRAQRGGARRFNCDADGLKRVCALRGERRGRRRGCR